MKVFPATDSQRRALENGEAVTVWERDERLFDDGPSRRTMKPACATSRTGQAG